MSVVCGLFALYVVFNVVAVCILWFARQRIVDPGIGPVDPGGGIAVQSVGGLSPTVLMVIVVFLSVQAAICLFSLGYVVLRRLTSSRKSRVTERTPLDQASGGATR